MHGKWIALGGFFLAFAMTGAPAFAEDYSITIKDHKFEPSSLEIPAGKRVKLSIINKDKTAEEFESHETHVEKMIAGGQTASVFVGPLEPGAYPFFGELHEDTAQGEIIAK